MANPTALSLYDSALAVPLQPVQVKQILDTNGATVVTTRQSFVADLTVTATSGSLPTANGAVTIANAALPTVAELQEFCVELNAKVNALLDILEAHGLMAAS